MNTLELVYTERKEILQADEHGSIIPRLSEGWRRDGHAVLVPGSMRKEMRT